jgi:general L-amino acid transport system substrate-binding protein
MTKATNLAVATASFALLCGATASAQGAKPAGTAEATGFLVPVSLGVSSALDLSGATVCVIAGSRSETAVATYFAAYTLDYLSILLASAREALEAYEASLCDVLAIDTVTLEGIEMHLANPDDHLILPETAR